MKTFNSVEELKPYYNENTNTYEFVENGGRLDVEFRFNLDVKANIYSGGITAMDINALDINASDIDAMDIKAWNINARDINADDINAMDIKAWNINARDINADDIKASDIKAWDITAGDISYYAVCVAYYNIECNSIKGIRPNAKHFVLDGDIIIKKKEDK